MQNRENLTIGVLSITGTVLFVGVILALSGGQNQVMAIGQLDRGGDYLMLTGQFTETSEVVYVTDGAAGRMNVYSYDRNQRVIRLWDSHDLKRLFGEARK